MRGQVLWYNETRAYGFIKPEDSDMEIFFHKRSIINPKGMAIASGVPVIFEINEDDPCKMTACEVTPQPRINIDTGKAIMQVLLLYPGMPNMRMKDYMLYFHNNPFPVTK
jgi:CspA family cold shock protein